MTNIATSMTPAEEASQKAFAQVLDCLKNGESFLLEAGAGAGKTYTLVKALQVLIDLYKTKLPKHHQKIACITYTNVATEEIKARTDRNPLIHCDTIHSFCWSLIRNYQKQLRNELSTLDKWTERIEEVDELGNREVEYTLGYRGIKDNRVSIHHDDVLVLTIRLMENAKFRRIVSARYPVILIDEYQDTNSDWIESIKNHFLGNPNSPQFGFFGDHWQKIYGDGCGKIEHPALTIIGKEANFRSASNIVKSLNCMRPELPQAGNDLEAGSVQIFHTNHWVGARQTGNHWKGDLPQEISHIALNRLRTHLSSQGWDLSSNYTKILMLTHRVLAKEQEYSGISSVFKFPEKYIKKEHDHIAFLIDKLEPACEAFITKQYGSMFTAIDTKRPAIKTQADKVKWSESMNILLNLRKDGTVGDVIKHLRKVRYPRIPDSIERLEKKLENFNKEGDETISNSLAELEKLHLVPYREVINLARYLDGHSPFQTKHGVKGAEFENVLVIVGRGWNVYDFNKMLEISQDTSNILEKDKKFFERNRNLFYVACSRPKKRLAILFTQEISNAALQTIRKWFGNEAIKMLEI